MIKNKMDRKIVKILFFIISVIFFTFLISNAITDEPTISLNSPTSFPVDI